jgi:YidC/Oxa1 family membrane protein insertase
VWGGFVDFLKNILTGINGITGNFAVSIILFTVLMRMVLLPLDLKAKASTKKMAELQPEIEKINKKYKNDPDKKNQKTLELYQKHKINPLGGCLPMLLQLPIFFALLAALRAISNVELEKFYIDLITHYNTGIGPSLEDFISSVRESGQNLGDVFVMLFSNPNASVVDQLKEIAGTENVTAILDTIKSITTQQAVDFLQESKYASYQFLWIKNIWVADSPYRDLIGRSIPFLGAGWNGLFILAALAGITSYYQMKISNPGAQNQQMAGYSVIFPIMSVWFTSMYTAAFGIYWVSNNIFQIIQQAIYNRKNPSQKSVKEGANK